MQGDVCLENFTKWSKSMGKNLDSLFFRENDGPEHHCISFRSIVLFALVDLSPDHLLVEWIYTLLSQIPTSLSLSSILFVIWFLVWFRIHMFCLLLLHYHDHQWSFFDWFHPCLNILSFTLFSLRRTNNLKKNIETKLRNALKQKLQGVVCPDSVFNNGVVHYFGQTSIQTWEDINEETKEK